MGYQLPLLSLIDYKARFCTTGSMKLRLFVLRIAVGVRTDF